MAITFSGYVDKTYFLQRIKEEDLNELTGGDDANLVVAVEDADSLIDGYLRARVDTLPLTVDTETGAVIPKFIKKISFTLAVYYLHDRIQPNDIPERIKDNYDTAIDNLKSIASGKISLDEAVVAADDVESTIDMEGDELQMSRGMF